MEKILPDGKSVNVPVKDLRIPKTGLGHTIQLEVGDFVEGFSLSNRRFMMFCDIFLFRKLSANTVYQLLLNCEEQKTVAGEIIIESGKESDTFYVIESGNVDVFTGKEMTPDHLSTTLQRGDIFGENALRRGRHVPRSASVVSR